MSAASAPTEAPAAAHAAPGEARSANGVSDPVPFPVNLNLDGRRVLVVGAGPVATRKIGQLLQAGARVTVVAPNATQEIANHEQVTWHQRPYRPGEAGDGYRLVVTATNDATVNAQVARDGDTANVFVNSADDPQNCSFTLMSVLRRGDLQITVSTAGRSPALARWLRRRLEEQIGADYVELLDLLAEVRTEARAVLGTSELPGWDAALDAELLDLVRGGRIHQARQHVRHCLGLVTHEAAATGESVGVAGWDVGGVGAGEVPLHVDASGSGLDDSAVSGLRSERGVAA